MDFQCFGWNFNGLPTMWDGFPADFHKFGAPSFSIGFHKVFHRLKLGYKKFGVVQVSKKNCTLDDSWWHASSKFFITSVQNTAKPFSCLFYLHTKRRRQKYQSIDQYCLNRVDNIILLIPYLSTMLRIYSLKLVKWNSFIVSDYGLPNYKCYFTNL